MTALCHLCRGPSAGPAFPYSTVWNGRRFDYLNCAKCGSTFVWPLPSESDFEAMYAKGAYHDMFYAEAADPDEFGASLALLDAHFARPIRLLDFGCGNGAFLAAARRFGHDCQGVEQSADSIEAAARSSGVAVRSLEQVEASGERYHVIRAADVLEHLPAPADVLQRLEKLLAPGGYFLIEGPLEKQRSLVYGFASRLKAARRLLGLDQEGVIPPYHLTSTNWRSQRCFFENVAGLRVCAHELYETGWPYPTEASPGAGIGGLVRSVVGAVAVRAARTATGRRLGLANRFRALLQTSAAEAQ